MPDERNAPHAPSMADMLSMWTRAQQQTIENWTDLWQTSSRKTDVFSELADQWRRVQQQSLSAWSSRTSPLAYDVFTRTLDGQSVLLRMTQMASEAWHLLGARMVAGEDWEAPLEQYTARFRDYLLRATGDAARAGQDAQDLWKGYAEQLVQLGNPWLDALVVGAGAGKERGEAGPAIAVFDRFFDAYEHTFGRLVDTPALGLSREIQEKVGEGFEAWQAFQRANVAYQTIIAETWTVAFERVLRRLVERAQAGEPVATLREYVHLWTDTADDVFVEAFSEDPYVEAQGELLRAGLAYRQRRRALLEYLQRAYDVPTRSEVDEVTGYVFEQRRTMRDLRKRLSDLEERVRVLTEELAASRGTDADAKGASTKGASTKGASGRNTSGKKPSRAKTSSRTGKSGGSS